MRPGVLRVIDEAASLPNVKLAICSASTKTSCLFVLDNLLGKPTGNSRLVRAGVSICVGIYYAKDIRKHKYRICICTLYSNTPI